MTYLPKWRLVLFVIAFACLATSMVYNFVGIRHAHTTNDYLEQANRAIPYIRHGVNFALLAFPLSFFGKGKSRIIAIACSSLLLIYWFLILESLY